MKQLNDRDESLFYCDVDINETTERFITPLKEYSIKNTKQVYILKKALGTVKEYNYDLSDIAIILTPKHPITLLNYGSAKAEDICDFLLDFKEDLGYLSDKFNYNKILGRARKWPEEWFSVENIDS